MQWYEILLASPIIIIGAYIRGKIYENKRNYFKNDSWEKRKKNNGILFLFLYVKILIIFTIIKCKKYFINKRNHFT